MEQLTTYKVTFKETADEWLFQYRKTDDIIYSFFNLKGSRILKLLDNNQFPGTVSRMEEWTKFKKAVTIELILDDYSFEAFWKAYNLKLKKELSQKAFEKLSNQGYKARRIPQNKYGLYPVLYGSYATFAEAEKAKQEIQNTINPDAWVLVESL